MNRKMMLAAGVVALTVACGSAVRVTTAVAPDANLSDAARRRFHAD